MTTRSRPRLTLIQTLLLIALAGVILSVALPRLLDRGGTDDAGQDTPGRNESGE